MSIIDFHPVITDDFSNPEPSLRELVFKYFSAHFEEQRAVELAREYCNQVENKMYGPHE